MENSDLKKNIDEQNTAIEELAHFYEVRGVP